MPASRIIRACVEFDSLSRYDSDMDAKNAVKVLVDEGRRAAMSRQRQLDDAERAALTMGAIGNLLKNRYGQTQAVTAELIGVAPATLSGWMQRATDAGHTAEDPIGRIVTVTPGRIADLLATSGAVIDRIVGGGSLPILAMTGLALDAFRSETEIQIPSLMAHNATDDSWIGVLDVLTANYFGTGPSNAYRAATELGVDPEIAEQIAYTNESTDLDMNTGVLVRGQVDFSQYPWELPQPHRDDPTVFVHCCGIRQVPERWITFLTTATPPHWADAPLLGRVYTTAQAAYDDGFTEHHRYSSRGASQLILERGQIQLWLSGFPPADPTRWLADEVYDVLDSVGLFPKEIRERDTASNIRKWLSSRGHPRPPFIDLDSQNRGRSIAFVPRIARNS